MISITAPADGRFRVHLPDGPIDLDAQETALERARKAARQLAHDRAKCGANAIEVAIAEDVRLVQLAPTNSCSSRPLSMPRQAAAGDISIGQTVPSVKLSAQLLA